MVHGFAGEFQTNHQRFTRGPRLNAVQITREFHGVGRHRHRTLSTVNGVVEQRGVAVEFGRPFRQRLGGRKRSRAQVLYKPAVMLCTGTNKLLRVFSWPPRSRLTP